MRTIFSLTMIIISCIGFSQPKVVINEIVTSPQQDWSSKSFLKDSIPGGTSGTNDEWIELYIDEDNLNLTSWTIELNDGTDIKGDLTENGAFDVVNYISENGGMITNTKAGDYIILGNVSGASAINNTGLIIILRNEEGDTIDHVTLGGGEENAPSGLSTSIEDESIARIPNAKDSNNDKADFIKATASIGKANQYKPATRNRGKSLVFDGNGDYLKLKDHPIYNLESFTIEAWVKVDNSSNGGMILAKKATSNEINYGLGVKSDGLPYVVYHDINEVEHISIGTSNLEDDEWHHLVGIYDFTNKQLMVFVDGTLEAKETSSEIPITGTSDTYIGAKSSSLTMFEGTVDEIAVWNIAKTQTDIRKEKHLTHSGNEEGLILYLQFNEKSEDATDVVQGNLAKFNGDVSRKASEANIADGQSTLHSISSLGTYTGNSSLSEDDLIKITFDATHPKGEIVITYLPDTPIGGRVDSSVINSGGIWIIDNYGINQTNLAATVEFWYPDGNITSTNLTDYQLYKRASNATTDWTLNNQFANAVSASSGNNYVKFSNVNEFSQFVMTSVISPLTPITPLAVDMLAFKGEVINNQVQLSWKTTNEIDNKLFVIERSQNGNTFNKLGEIKGAGNSQLTNTYQFTDHLPLPGLSYYRIKTIDYSDQEEHSELIVIQNEIPFSMTLKPNPFFHTLELELSSKKSLSYKLKLYDMYGNIIIEEPLTSNADIISHSFNTTSLSTGVYILQLALLNEIYSYRLIKK